MDSEIDESFMFLPQSWPIHKCFSRIEFSRASSSLPECMILKLIMNYF